MHAQLKKEAHDPRVWHALAAKYEERNDTFNTLDVWKMIKLLDKPAAEEADFRIAQLSSEYNNRLDEINTYINDHPGSPYIAKAQMAVVNYYRKEKNAEAEAEAYKAYSELINSDEENWVQKMNGYCWRMATLELNLDDAIGKIRRAIAAISSDNKELQAQTMDTEAELLWKQGKAAEAIKVIDKCILLQPDDDYYSKQKSKFSGEQS